MLTLKVKKLNPEAKLPTKNNLSDAAFDLYANEYVSLRSGQATKIKTGIAVEIPDGYYGQIFDRSSIGALGISVLGGVIDSGYRGEIIVCLLNNNLPDCGMKYEYYSTDHYEKEYYSIDSVHLITKGNKIAQMVILPVPQVEVEEVEELSDSDRGTKGFGSSGK
jgi:dUTP pyrophosphatase